MPKVLRFRTTWGISPGKDFENWAKWFPDLKKQGYAGIEVDTSSISDDFSILRRICDEQGFEISVLIHSQWPSYIGPRPIGLKAEDHLKRYREELERAKPLRPLKLNIHAGSDHWPVEESIKFFRETLRIDSELGYEGKVSHETHRLRSFFNPFTTAYILSQVPELRVTADISHHVVVCERLLDVSEEDKDLLSKITPHVTHIHARIGTTQSSQCPDPTNPVFNPERTFHETFWKQCIDAIIEKCGPDAPITFVPEYGPYPYHPFGSARDFSEVADTEGARLQKLFEDYISAKK